MRQLSQLLAKAPAGAVRAEREATMMQAGHSSRTGGYRDAAGRRVEEGRPDSLVVIGEIVRSWRPALLLGLTAPVSTKVLIQSKKPKTHFLRGQMTTGTSYDSRSTIHPRQSRPLRLR
ncbi:hypothetical protein FHT82_004378 [Rhizobium sp. BK275]|uniref:hypothetical protein n=1 Tax=Rhizobium sp. BK275 TaxID=2587077 RepID=UPI001619769D|nr:hypothetical protein [Rhizobium sp. BK275]MBB3391600.1 hypothetical protein [Rhizobium sp. BK275]